MTTALEQYALEISWSTQAADDIVAEAIKGDIPLAMEFLIRDEISKRNDEEKISNEDLFVKFFSLILREKIAKPVQAIGTQVGLMAGIKDAADAFAWGLQFIKACEKAKLYRLEKHETEWYVIPNFTLDKKTQQALAKLQYLPPMQIRPTDWDGNFGGGWLWEQKHLILGSKFTKHSRPLAYDVINKLQGIRWEIDTDTYMHEKDTNRQMNKKKFLRVIHEYLGKPFHFVWRYDSRGRSYSSGYDLNLQSNEYGKALLSLHDREPITQMENLFVAIAGHAGKDKLTWQERIDWVHGQDPDEIEWEQPILGRKAIRAYEASQAGNPSGYVMSLDATSSGLQIMAVISGCKQTAKLVNCTDPTKRWDLYDEVAGMMNAKLAKPVPRKVTKQCVMTHYYNSKATPKAMLNDAGLEAFYDTLNGLLPGAEDVMETINACWNPQADHHSWVMPDGHHVYVPIVEGVNATFTDADLGDIPIRYYRQMPSENYRSLCPNVIHSIDGYVAREMIRRCQFQLSHIHDCFVFSPDHLQEVADTYREIMAELANSNIFEDILQQITGDHTIKITKYSQDLADDILKSEYMLS